MSEGLNHRQIVGILAAAGHADRIGLPLGDFLTVHWEKLGLSDSEAAAATGALLKSARKFCESAGLPFAAVWVRENDAGDGSKGSHLHCLLFIPPTLRQAFLGRLGPWLRALAKRPYSRRARKLERIGGLVNMASRNPPVHAAGLAKLLDYVSKGADAETARAFGFSRHDEGGRVIGKRCGFTENLGPAARFRWEAGNGGKGQIRSTHAGPHANFE